MRVIYSPAANEFLRKLAPPARRRILKKIRFFASAPDPLWFAEHLTDDVEAPYRFRIGKDWRIKFSVAGGIIEVKRIGRRDSIYG